MPKYLDAASSTPVDKRVMDAMYPYFSEIYGNASSNHDFGKKAKTAIDNARRQVASLIKSNETEVIFTSGATESINMALKGYIDANFERGNHIITVKTEHKAVLETCKYLEERGVEVTYLDVDKNGLISLNELEAFIKKNTILICVMYVNNETGVIQPIHKIGELAREKNICFFCDATQAIGKIPVDVKNDNIDMLCFSAHKLNGPKGVGVLYKSNDIQLTPLIHGGSQENGLRAGTYNTPLIVGLGKACELATLEFEKKIKETLKLRNIFEKEIEENKIGEVCFKNSKRAPHISCIRLNNIEADKFLISNNKRFIASNGSACNSSLIEVSHVYKEIFKEPKKIIRISF